jgi:DNA-binding MarR family transcriptional regulator
MTTKPASLRLDDQLCFSLYSASRAVTGLYRTLLDDLELTYPQYLVMLALWEHSPRSVKEIGSALQLDPATLSPLLKRLEAAGFIRRERSTVDERVLDITLTDAGRRLRDQAESIPPTVVSNLGMSIDELTKMRETLHAVITAATPA